MLRNVISQFVVAAALIAMMPMAGVGLSDTIDRTGPVKPVPNPRFVVQLACKIVATTGGPDVYVVNTLNSQLKSGHTISWSYHQLGGLRNSHTWNGVDVAGSKVLAQTLGAGQSIKVAQTTSGSQLSNCKAATTIGG